ncbi:enhancer of mRNA decapping [Acarospora aff. strigata]|nr:enhancer of mRNA decapping [Acarospora aff. strigata]
MAADFIGLTVLVTLQSPPDAKIQGLVADVVGRQLFLRDVIFLESGHRMPEWQIEGSNIADLDVAPNPSTTGHSENPVTVYSNNVPLLPQTQTPHVSEHQLYSPAFPPSAPDDAATLLPKPPTKTFTDPAILSFGKPPTLDSGPSRVWIPRPQPLQLPQAILSEAMGSSPTQIPPMISLEGSMPRAIPSVIGARERTDSVVTATLTAPFDGMKLNGDTDGLEDVGDTLDKAGLAGGDSVPVGRRKAQPLETPVKYTGKRSRRGGRGRAQRDAAMQMPPVSVEAPADIDTSPAVVRKNQQSIRTKGWRQTSLIEETIGPAQNTPGLIAGKIGRQAASSSKRKTRHHHQTNGDDQNGWATEDATDIQDMGDFDFEGNLSKFDKRSVFDQIRNEDTTADEERLVSFNRRPARPGTEGGKNLHYTENVLDLPRSSGRDKRADSEESDEEELDTRISSGRSSRRTLSRASTRHVSRKGSGITSTAQPKTTTLNSLLSSLNRGQYPTFHDTGTPRPSKHTAATSPVTGPHLPSKPSLRTLPSNKVCHCVSPLQMLEVEGVAISKLGLTDDMMTENAARAIAEVSLSAIAPSGPRPHRENHNHNSLPIIVVLAGNHKSGARAIAGGRHLCNHGVRVLICMVGYEHDEELVESVCRQLDIFQKSGGRVVQSTELFSTLKALDDAPVELVVDALLGMHAAFDDLRPDDQVVTYELIEWANQLNTTVLAVDVPTGLDASTGTISLLPSTTTSSPLLITPNIILAMGAPKTGLLNALINGNGNGKDKDKDWQIKVADLGISNAAWRKYGTRRRHGVEFGPEWVLGLRFSE